MEYRREERYMSGRSHVVRGRDVIGADVVNRDGESLGSIQDLVFDAPTGRIAYAVLSFGGFLGVGNKLFALPWPALQWSLDRNAFVLDIPRERLESAPGFDPDNWPDMANREWQTDVSGYYGYRPYWEEGEEYRRAA